MLFKFLQKVSNAVTFFVNTTLQLKSTVFNAPIIVFLVFGSTVESQEIQQSESKLCPIPNLFLKELTECPIDNQAIIQVYLNACIKMLSAFSQDVIDECMRACAKCCSTEVLSVYQQCVIKESSGDEEPGKNLSIIWILISLALVSACSWGICHTKFVGSESRKWHIGMRISNLVTIASWAALALLPGSNYILRDLSYAEIALNVVVLLWGEILGCYFSQNAPDSYLFDRSFACCRIVCDCNFFRRRNSSQPSESKHPVNTINGDTLYADLIDPPIQKTDLTV